MKAFLPLKSLMCVCGISALLLLSGCVEQSTVVKVKQDGSGLVHIRLHQKNVTIFGTPSKEETIKLPSEAQIDLAMEQMGGDVQFVSLEKSENRSGWSGYDLILQFADVNNLIVPSSLSKTLSTADASNSEDAEDASKQANDAGKTKPKNAPSEMELSYRFAMSGDQLEIVSFGYSEEKPTLDPNQDAAEGAIDPFAQEPESPSGSLSNAAFQEFAIKAMADARIGLFVQLDGEVIESNAKYQKGNLVTLLEAKIGEMVDNEKSMAMLKGLSKKNTDSMTRAQAAEFDALKGMSIDTQEKVVVKFK